MSTHDEQAFTEALRIQAVGAGTPTLTLDDVRGRARGIRRRRAAVVAGGAAALVAAAVLPVALLVGGGDSPDTLPPADGTPTVVDSDNPVITGRLDQTGTWVVGDQVDPAVGEPFTPDVEGDLFAVVGLADGRWVVSTGGADPAVTVTDAEGGRLATYPALDAYLAHDDARTSVAWIGPDGRVVLLTGDPASDPFTLPAELDARISAPQPIEVLPGCGPEECVVLVEVVDRSPFGSSPVAVTTGGEVQSLDRTGLFTVVDVSPDGALASGIVDYDEFGQELCSAVVVFATGEELWRDCEVGNLRFSPNGTEVLAIDGRAEGFGHFFVEVRDALDGEVVSRFEKGSIFDEQWAGDDELHVALQLEDGTHQLVEVSVDGTRESLLVEAEGAPGDPEGMVRLGG